MPYKNPEARRAWERSRRKGAWFSRWRIRIAELKAYPCTDCGGTFPSECMDFDHVRGKKLCQISQMGSRRESVLRAELAKCELVCANCHRIRTRRRKNAKSL